MSPTKGTIKFGFSKKRKARYIRHFDIIARVGELTYELVLPPSLDKVHNLLHISKFKKYICDESYIIQDYREVNIQPEVTYVEEPIRILDRWNKVLRKKIIPLVKVMLRNQGHEEFSSKEEDLKEYFHSFQEMEQGNF